MFSFFTDLGKSSKTTTQNENNVVFRKPRISTRNPLKDCRTNIYEDSTPCVKRKPRKRPVFIERQIRSDVFLDFCSYEDVEDTYEDLNLPELVLGDDVLDNIICAFSRKSLEDPEPVEFVIDRPKLVDVCFDLEDPDLMNNDEIAALLNVDLEYTELDVPFDDLL